VRSLRGGWSSGGLPFPAELSAPVELARRGLETRRKRQGDEARLGVACLVGRAFFDAHAQVEPGGLSGDRIRVGVTPALLIRQEVADRVVEQEAAVGLACVGCEVPCAAALAYGVPGPDRVRVDAIDQ